MLFFLGGGGGGGGGGYVFADMSISVYFYFLTLLLESALSMGQAFLQCRKVSLHHQVL